MRPRFVLFTALTLCALASSAGAVPINVDFSAVLDRPVNGSNTVTGSFWYESNVGQLFMTGVSVSSLGINQAGASIAVGGKTYLFPPWQGQPSPGDYHDSQHADFYMGNKEISHADTFTFVGRYGLDASGVTTEMSFEIRLRDPDVRTYSIIPTLELPAIDLSDYPIHEFKITDADGNLANGWITSMSVNGNAPVTIDPPPVPEPSTLVVLSWVTLAWMARARRHRAGSY